MEEVHVNPLSNIWKIVPFFGAPRPAAAEEALCGGVGIEFAARDRQWQLGLSRRPNSFRPIKKRVSDLKKSPSTTDSTDTPRRSSNAPPSRSRNPMHDGLIVVEQDVASCSFLLLAAGTTNEVILPSSN